MAYSGKQTTRRTIVADRDLLSKYLEAKSLRWRVSGCCRRLQIYAFSHVIVGMDGGTARAVKDALG